MLSAAAVSSLHHERFAVGSAVNQTARQVGGALGVALLVVILGTPRSAAAALSKFSPPLVVRSSDGGPVGIDEHPPAIGSRSAGFWSRSCRGSLERQPSERSRESGDVGVTVEDLNWGEQRAKTVVWHDPMITAEAATQLTGLEFLRAHPRRKASSPAHRNAHGIHDA